MIETLQHVFNNTSVIDFFYLVITILSLIQCYRKGFVLSILSMTKWILAYVITLILFPSVKPYIKDIIDNLDLTVNSNDDTHRCLDTAIITPRDKMTENTMNKLKTVAGRVLFNNLN